MKKLLAVVMVAVMCISMGATVFAAGSPEGSEPDVKPSVETVVTEEVPKQTTQAEEVQGESIQPEEMQAEGEKNGEVQSEDAQVTSEGTLKLPSLTNKRLVWNRGGGRIRVEKT